MAKERAERNTFRIRLDTVLAHSGRAIGWLGLVFWGAVGAAGFAELAGGADRAVDRVMPFLCLFFAALHVLLILSSARLRALIRDFRQYSALLAVIPDKSVPRLAAALGQPLETVLARVEKMCGRGYFHASLDRKSQRLLFPSFAAQQHAVRCPGCGAPSVIGDTCRYCGSPLNIPD